ncbi:hypothetical protein QAD02_005569 [Eretmocerus hayati]|uniref:Uncharacterized protein n=1 Tax=Eretmocerus hayati TaxID=131215 RepID=A0ACC2NVR3_9HYME|nr:hypothetical protein QAD02_005569 [Eretmocerus hayati]
MHLFINIQQDVARYLKNDKLGGVPLFAIYEKRAFNKKERSKISAIVIEAELNGNPNGTISPARFKELALQTTAIFPLETTASYYIEATTNVDGKRQAPKGCYYNHYVNRGRVLRKDGVRTSLCKSSASKSERIALSGVSNDALVAHERLQKNIPDRSWSEIEADWDLTHDIRRDELLQPSAVQNKTKRIRFTYAAKQDENSIHAYMKKYLPLEQPLGLNLLKNDFKKTYLNIPIDALSKRWQQIVSMLEDLYPEEEGFGDDDLKVLQLFASLFDPFLIKGRNKAFWRPAKQEIVDGFILHVKSVSDIEASVKRIRDQLALVKKTMQPIPIIVDGQNGNYLCYVQIESIRYSVPNVREALDLCFKSYHALHAEYPVQSVGPWLLLQKESCFRSFSSWRIFKRHLIENHETKSTSQKTISRKSCRDETIEQLPQNCSTISSERTLTSFALSLPENYWSGLKETTAKAKIENSKPTSLVSDSTIQFDVNLLDALFEQFERQLDDIITKHTLELYADPNLAQIEVQRMVNRTKDLLNVVVETFKSMLQLLNKDIVIDRRVQSAIHRYFSMLTSVIQKHDTHYKRCKRLSQDGLISPLSVIVGSAMEDKCKDNQIVKELVPRKAYYISVRSTFKAFFEKPGVLKTVLKYMKALSRNTSVLSNWIQGESWRAKMIKYYANQIVIPFLMYIDDFDVNDPLGSHKGIQKMCGIYCSIMTLPPEFRSLLENIFLVMLFHSSDRKEFGWSRILSHLVDEFNELAREGIEFLVDGEKITVYFVLAVVIGDNLGLNSLFGMVESFMAHFFCRLCKVIKLNTQTDSKERKESLRAPEDYENDLEEGYTQSGLKEYCILNEIDHYHIYENPYFDILHDISEGGLKFALVEILYYFIIEIETLDFDIFNDRLKTFNYTGNGFSNKPPSFVKEDVQKKKFSLTASETMTLYLILPFLIGDQIDLEDEVWQFYLVLREVLDLIQARDIQIECTYLIDSLIETHHEMYVRLFKRPLRPKQHNGVHYGSSIRKGGPMSPINTIRYEANHKFFKTAADSTSSRKEIGYTLSMKNQFNFHYHIKYGDGLSTKLETGRLSPTPTYLMANFPALTEDSQQCSWVKFRGLHYKPGTCVVMKLDEEDRPIFGCIDSIFINKNSRLSLLCSSLRTEYFDQNLHSYLVDWSNKHEFLENIDSLFSPFPVMMHKMPNDCLYVAPKHAL